MIDRAELLIELLGEHVDLQLFAEGHYSKAAYGTFMCLADEKDSYKALSKAKHDFMFDVATCGFKYITLEQIIPSAFKTTHDQRLAILADLTEYAESAHE